MFWVLNMIEDTDPVRKRKQLEEGEKKREEKTNQKILKAVEAT